MIVVTGGLGFIGSNLVVRLSGPTRSDEPFADLCAQPVVVVDHYGVDERWQNVAEATVDRFIRPAELAAFLEVHRHEVRGVLHMGAISATTERDIDAIVANNIEPSLFLWDWCAAAGVPLVYASSAATYGDGSEGFDDDPDPNALARLRPLNAYGWSKSVVDRSITARLERGGKKPPHWAGLKFFNVYGPREFHKEDMRSVALKLYQAHASGEPWSLFKSHRPDYLDGGQLRDFIYVADCVDVALWCLQGRATQNGIFNVGTGAARSFADLAAGVASALGEDIPVTYRDMPEELRGRYQYFTQARTERLRAAGYDRQFTSLEAGLQAYVSWLKAFDRS